MAYNLRNRPLRELLLEDERQAEAFDKASDDEEDHVSEDDDDEDEYEPSEHSSEQSAASSDDELENASLEQRLLDAREKRQSLGAQSISGTAQANGRPVTTLRGKNNYKWSTKQPQRHSDRNWQHEEREPGPTGPAVGLSTIEEVWEVLFPVHFIENIAEHTNTEIQTQVEELMAKGHTPQTYHTYTDAVEVRALIGLFYYSGAWKSANMDLHILWGEENGLSVYRCVMSRMRFTFLCSCLRFDDKASRNRLDRFAPIRELWELFINNCQSCYNMSDTATVDEQLLSFRGRCTFRMYMKAKPDKYGLKIVTLNDAKTAYLYYGIPYLGKDSNYTLLQNETKPESQMKVASKTIPDTNFCFANKITLLSHTPKKNRIVLLASTFLQTTNITEGKPDIILHYNKTKGGTDTFDQLCHAYETARRTNRWSMRYFYGILDQAAVNSRILLQLNKLIAGENIKVLAFNCLLELAKHLTRPLLLRRLNNPATCISIKTGIRTVLKVDEPNFEVLGRPTVAIKLRCQICPRAKDKKSRMKCPSCERIMCDEHRIYMCIECAGLE